MRYERKGFSDVESAIGKELYKEDPDFARCLRDIVKSCGSGVMIRRRPSVLRCLPARPALHR